MRGAEDQQVICRSALRFVGTNEYHRTLLNLGMSPVATRNDIPAVDTPDELDYSPAGDAIRS